ncbi:potential ADP-ribosylation factor [Pseudozyma hubeiensis SY62]|uniref:Signal recognition particle receptor subunit beta n=1 Tax=Pseudozyma hubeiensis (strain SY62) TaxID=1305764 RepID=R9P0P7_PSEHS|nr:potential ADP-ribosylation factor [Pseudozyma hubeiensis SY62]GAC94637.1 potential ADP-ribosylation factor [Pseudozyma hubeiensis SY62]
MAFVAPAVRWPDAVASHLPQPLKDSGIPPQYFVIVPATLLAVVLTYTLSKASAKVNAPHLASLSSESEYTTKRSHNRPSTVVLVGLSDTGKTSLFSSLVYGTTPSTLPSQTMSQGVVAAPTLQEEKMKPVTLVDLPGHPRLRPLVDEHLHQADGLVVCVDAVTASKASSSTSRPGDAATITDVADLMHSTLTALAKQRAKSSTNTAPPSVLVLFTRADLSPLLGGSAAGTDAIKDEKRRAQLLSRCKTTLEAELGQRRANMGFGRRRAGGGAGGNVKIAGLGKVADADPGATGGADGVFGWIKRALGLGGDGGSSGSADANDAEEEEEEDEVVDYIDWAASQRAVDSSDAAVGGASFSLEKLDDHVVFGGKVEFALASVGKDRSWSHKSDEAQEKQDEADKKVFASGGLDEFKRWIVDLQS